MDYACKPNSAEARQRLRAFWSCSKTDRPALWVVVKKPDRRDPVWDGAEDRKGRELLPDYQCMMLDQELDRYEYLAEAMPGYALDWGCHLVTLAVFAGGDYDYQSWTAWIQRMPDLYSRPLPRFDVDQPIAIRLTEILQQLAERARGRCFVNPPVMLDALTTMSRFRGTEQLCMDLMERPADVVRWSRSLTDLYNAVYGHFHRLVTTLGFGDTNTWLRVMAEGRFEAVQCDFAVTLSPAMFADFVLPDLRDTVAHLDYALYHLDGVEQMRFLDLLRQCEGLHGIQWNPQTKAGWPGNRLDDLRRIRRQGFCLYAGCDSVDEAAVVTQALGPDGLFLVLPPFDSRSDAERAVLRLEDASRAWQGARA